MFSETEMLLFEVEYLFSRVRRLALSLGVDPVPRWFKDAIGVTELQVRRFVALEEDDTSGVYRFLLDVKKALLDLAKQLQEDGGDDDAVGAPVLQLSPRRRKKRRGRDLLD